MNNGLMINIAVGFGLAIFTLVVLKLGAGAFTIVMATFAAIVFALILMSPDEKEKDRGS